MDILNAGFEKRAVLQKADLPGTAGKINLFVKRIDLVHPEISGNKWYKMKYNLIEAKERGYDTILTFGGAYSNHIHAAAAAGKKYGFKTIGIIRGEKYNPLNPTLQFAADMGMELHYLDRNTYRRRNEEEFIDDIKKKFPGTYVLPEGGSNIFAVKGCREIPRSIDISFDYICSAVGSGGTISGIIAGLSEEQKAIGFPVMKNGLYLKEIIEKFLSGTGNNHKRNWSLIPDYHFGGFAKINRELAEFLIEFERINSIPLDYIYTGKMMYGIFNLVQKNFFKEKDTVIAVHTGGLQGNAGMKEKIERVLPYITSA